MATTLPAKVVIVPFRGERTRLYGRVTNIAFGLAVILMIAGAANRNLFVVWLGIAALVPVVLPTAVVRRLPGGQKLISVRPPRIELDHDGMTAFDWEGRIGRVAWDEIAGMEVDRWTWGGTLVGLDGAKRGYVDPSFIRPQMGLVRSPSLAVQVVDVRPDLFALSTPVIPLAQPWGFHRPAPGYEQPNLAAIRRRQDTVQIAFVLILVTALTALMIRNVSQ